MLFDFQPVLVGTLLELRSLVAEDWDALFAVASDPLVWEQHPNSDRYKAEVFREFFGQAMDSCGAFAVIDRKNGCVIGSSRYHGYSKERSEVEIGWTFLDRRYWGGRYNREMKHLMLRHAFQFVDTVLFFVGPRNIRSQKAMEKIGGIPLGQNLGDDGKEHVVFRIKAKEFKAHSNQKLV